MCELWLQPRHLRTVLHPAAGKGRKSAPCSGRARLDTASSCPCTQHMPCWYPNLGDGAASVLHSASTADPSPQASSDTNRHCHDGGEIKRVGEAQFPLTSASVSPTLKAHEPACPQELSLTRPTTGGRLRVSHQRGAPAEPPAAAEGLGSLPRACEAGVGHHELLGWESAVATYHTGG